ncbi:delta(3,5)-Delta(2,4)-dienoyl-CoA isomerase, mitochondrial [Protobothrops mucrosquamatus]|uniref:delta(3,5)-Delta(2,4)-dienoyl-CoA isomerase, mitochondrial n=1 Tax=Protobothrops mucrosquamatus TaxID=103944 RepID=UPI000775EC37|nr:delta(3,5)-Delta(2,4)-dienoyl-CoA isomerase, mitochondrial [Protobothrops mucrosquamatus]
MASKQQQSSQQQPNALPTYETLKLERVRDKVLHVELNRPEKRNAMNIAFWREMVECFNKIAEDSECHAVVISGAGKMFTAGIDLMELGSIFVMAQGDDMARKAWNIRKKIQEYQESFTVLEKCPKPVIVAVHGACIGGDLHSQAGRSCHNLNNSSGFVFSSRVFRDHESMLQGAFDLATEIACRSPVAVQGTKINLVYSRDHSVPDGLKYMIRWTLYSYVQTEDIIKSAQAVMEKKTPKQVVYSKL